MIHIFGCPYISTSGSGWVSGSGQVIGGVGRSGQASRQVSGHSGQTQRGERKDDWTWRSKQEWTGVWKWRDGQKWSGDWRRKWEQSGKQVDEWT